MERIANHRPFHERKYAFKKHHATRLHYDLRLEWNGFLLSWALPEGPSCNAGIIREAIEMEDHRTINLLFEGVHHTGPIMLWDRGTWEPHLECGDIKSSLSNGILQFTLRGEKLQGSWTLIRTNSLTTASRPIWGLSKEADLFASNHCVLKERPNSVSTGRTLEEIVQDWTKGTDRHNGQSRLFDDI
jgi:bifunctional non-homologous end joining protein LigD